MVESIVPSMPPHWIAVQLVLGDKDGLVPERETEAYSHFCCQDCFTLYTTSQQFTERLLLADQEPPDEEDDEGEEMR